VERQETIGGQEELDVLWPFLHREEGPEREVTAVRPIFRRTADHQKDSYRLEALYPFIYLQSDPGRTSSRVLPFAFFRSLTDEEGREDRDWSLFPLFYGGTDPEEGDYFLFFPFWGNLRGYFARQEIRFRLFPLYMDTRDRDWRSVHFLWPLIQKGEGSDKHEWRFLPFYSTSTWEGHEEYRAVLWPIFNWSRTKLYTEHPVTSFMVFPLFGRTWSDVESQTTLLWPFFTFASSDRGYRETNLFWPVFRTMQSPEGSAFRLWPLYSRSRVGGAKEDWYLWPVIWDEEFVVGDGRLRSFKIVPIWRNSRYLAGDGSLRAAETQLWPIYQRRTAADGSWHLKSLAPIPIPNWQKFTEYWEWLWTVLDVRVAGERGTSVSALFGLIQYRQGGGDVYAGIPLLFEVARKDEDQKIQLAKGLLGLESTERGAGLRLLWFLTIGF
jgi:hypothetical protein